MKKLLLILLLCPIFVFGQSLTEIISDPIKVDTATVYTETGILDFNKSVGRCLWAGGTFLFIGTVTNVISFSVKPKSLENYNGIESYDKYIDKFAKNQKAATIVGWSSIGLSAVLFFSGGVIYAKQDKMRKGVVIRGGTNSISLSYKFKNFATNKKKYIFAIELMPKGTV